MGVSENNGKFYPDSGFSEKAWIRNIDQYKVVDPAVGNPDSTVKEMPVNETGHLCIEKSWPSLSRTIYKDHERYE